MKIDTTVYEVKFQIKTTTYLGKDSGYVAKEAHIDQYNPTQTHQNRNEAIDVAISRLLSLKTNA